MQFVVVVFVVNPSHEHETFPWTVAIRKGTISYIYIYLKGLVCHRPSSTGEQ